MTDQFKEGNPTVPGWYAVLYCWEIEEGIMNDALYWTGEKWDVPHNTNVHHCGPFPDRDSAYEFSRKNNPENIDGD